MKNLVITTKIPEAFMEAGFGFGVAWHGDYIFTCE